MYGIDQEILDRVIARRGRLHAYETIDAAKTALVIIDLQNYFMKPEYPSSVPAAREIVPKVNEAARVVRSHGGTVVWISTSSAGAEIFWSVKHKYLLTPAQERGRKAGLKPGNDGFDLWSELDIAEQDLKVTKRTYSALIHGSSPLESELRGRGIDTVLIGGTVTDVCCESTGRDAMMLNFKTIMLADALAAKQQSAHIAALSGFIENFGDVMLVEEMAARLK
ncbi:isochorismatase family cysteine hydrolase [Pigmentiphaga sp.]|uniref:isochorismatase family cysteine hydrolase n=1 Tax=Pigmentiphaga sp. TaxID=1977564 RepID=UPI0025EE35DA|nr:isochorismatase family cysteine hydrolase [Pigmentiphaga sp.]MBX6319024.1 cysteine hydrolase [Pigmentiphaga sp.]